MNVRLNLPELHHGQVIVKKQMSSKEWTFVCAHRGWRKSSLAINVAVEHMLNGGNVGWYAPTMKVIETSNWLEFKKICGGDESWFIKSEQTWTIPRKGTCFFYSMEKPANVRGGTFDLAIAEEMGEWGDGVFESFVEPIIRKVGGKLLAIGTPNIYTPENDFYNYVMEANSYPEQASYIIPAWGADLVDGKLVQDVSPYSDMALRDAYPFPTFRHMEHSYARSKNPERWRIEYLCHFISAMSEGIDGVDNACILPYHQVISQ